ncbi:MAG: sensor histidine kinase [Thermoleophilia bacterium]
MERIEAIARALRVPRPVDLAIAGALAAWALVEALVVDGPGTPLARVAFALAATVPLLWRRIAPLPILLLICGLLVLRATTADVPEYGTVPFPSMLVATFSVGAHTARAWLAVPAVAAPIAAMVTASQTDFWSSEPQPGDLAILTFFVIAAWTAGRVVRHRSLQAARAAAAGGELAREAVAAERARVARELHDVVAHSVSIIAVQAGAAESLIDRDPDRARDHIAAVRRTAGEAMTEMRRLLGVLREDEAVYAPQPTLADLDRLVDEVRAAGTPVELVREGADDAPLPPGVDLAAYRIVQEALTNVRRHAGAAPTRVVVRRSAGLVDVEVVNAVPDGPGEGPGGGHGLPGMRERVRLYGGSLDAGPRDDGGFGVRARLPLPEPA